MWEITIFDLCILIFASFGLKQIILFDKSIPFFQKIFFNSIFISIFCVIITFYLYIFVPSAIIINYILAAIGCLEIVKVLFNIFVQKQVKDLLYLNIQGTDNTNVLYSINELRTIITEMQKENKNILKELKNNSVNEMSNDNNKIKEEISKENIIIKNLKTEIENYSKNQKNLEQKLSDMQIAMNKIKNANAISQKREANTLQNNTQKSSTVGLDYIKQLERQGITVSPTIYSMLSSQNNKK